MGHLMGRARLIMIGMLAVLALAVPVVALASTSTVSVSAGLVKVGHPPKLHLRITVNGHRGYDQAVRATLCGDLCITTPVTPAANPIRVLDLQSNGTLQVILGLYSGGAHCCFIDEVFVRRAHTDTYVQAAQQNFLDAGARLQTLGGHWSFVSADARIAEDSFTDFADSGSPLQIWRFRSGRFVDVTRSYPSRVARDAAQWLRAFNHHIANGVGFIAAWAADEDLLGHGARVRSTLASEARRGRLHSALGLPHNSQTAFVAALLKQLRRLGYPH